MPEFTYIARNMAGEKVSGEMSAATERDVVNALSGQSLFPVKVEAEVEPRQFSFGGGRVSGQQIAAFYEQLASLIKNGVPMLKALVILKEQAGPVVMRDALEDVISRVEDGENLADSFARHPKVFSEMAVNMSRAGAEGGFLEDALERVASFTEQQADMKSRTVGALVYPAVLATIGTIVVSVLIIFFVPKFEEIFNQLRAMGELPAITEWLLAFSRFLQRYIVIGIIIAAILFVLVRVQINTEKGRQIWDGLKLKIPLFGPIFRNLAVSRFCRVLGTLLKNGVPILRGLTISADAAGNRVLAQAINKASDNITSGESLSVPLSESGQFPRNITEMMTVAEESNTLDTVLVSAADNLEKNTMRRLDLMVKLIEPLMLLVMAGVILVVVIALLLPIMKMGQVLE